MGRARESSALSLADISNSIHCDDCYISSQD